MTASFHLSAPYPASGVRSGFQIESQACTRTAHCYAGAVSRVPFLNGILEISPMNPSRTNGTQHLERNCLELLVRE